MCMTMENNIPVLGWNPRSLPSREFATGPDLRLGFNQERRIDTRFCAPVGKPAFRCTTELLLDDSTYRLQWVLDGCLITLDVSSEELAQFLVTQLMKMSLGDIQIPLEMLGSIVSFSSLPCNAPAFSPPHYLVPRDYL